MGNDIHDPDPIISTLSGEINLLAPSAADIDFTTMAVTLARKGRYNDLSNLPFTVGQHLLLCDAILTDRYPQIDVETRALVALHDGHEYVMGDFTRPMKRLLDHRTGGLITEMERRLDRAIFSRFGLPIEMAEVTHPARQIVRKIDTIALATEVRVVFPVVEKRWEGLPPVSPHDIEVCERLEGYETADTYAVYLTLLEGLFNEMAFARGESGVSLTARLA